jgi:hypothetical protein
VMRVRLGVGSGGPVFVFEVVGWSLRVGRRMCGAAVAAAVVALLVAVLPAAAAARPSRVAHGATAVRLSATKLLAAAPPGSPLSKPNARARLSYRWAIVRRPRHSRARLLNPRRARPRLKLDKPGRYLVRLRVSQRHRRPGAEGESILTETMTVWDQPSYGPIGAAFDTAAVNGQGRSMISLGSKTVDTGGSPATAAIFDRRTLQLVDVWPVGNQASYQEVVRREAIKAGTEGTEFLSVFGGSGGTGWFVLAQRRLHADRPAHHRPAAPDRH